MTKAPPKNIVVLKLKLTKESWEPLPRISDLCRRAHNAAVEDWLLRQRGMPESDRQKNGVVKRKSDAKPITESTKLYHAAVAAVPAINTSVASMVSRKVCSSLSAKVDWRRGITEDGKRRKRSDSILAYEDRPPFSIADVIPVPSRQCTLRVDDRIMLSARIDGAGKRIRNVDVEVTGKLPPRFRKLLREMSDGHRKMADSSFVLKGGEWFWFLPVAFDAQSNGGEAEATLAPVVGGDGESMFLLDFGGESKPWKIGAGRYFLAQSARMVKVIKEIGWRYRQGGGQGHGRKKVDDSVKSRRKRLRDIVDEVRRNAINETVRGCQRHGVGHLIYREPTNPAKDKLWFAVHGVEWDWTRFGNDLQNVCRRPSIGIEVTVNKLKITEVLGEQKKAS